MMNGHDNTINDIILKGSAPCGRPLAVLQSYSGGEEATKKLLADSRSRACCARAASIADRCGIDKQIHRIDSCCLDGYPQS